MTKNEKYLIKQWIQYHGEIFGYENIYVIDDSDDVEVLDYYNFISKAFPINIYFNNPNLNNIVNKINQIMNYIKCDCDFMIKMDTDEFIGVYDENTNEVSINKEIIRNTFNKLIVNGYKYKCSLYNEFISKPF
jgi:hypothetical protein